MSRKIVYLKIGQPVSFLPLDYTVVFKTPRDVNGNLLNAIAIKERLDSHIFWKADPGAR